MVQKPKGKKSTCYILEETLKKLLKDVIQGGTESDFRKSGLAALKRKATGVILLTLFKP